MIFGESCVVAFNYGAPDTCISIPEADELLVGVLFAWPSWLQHIRSDGSDRFKTWSFAINVTVVPVQGSTDPKVKVNMSAG